MSVESNHITVSSAGVAVVGPTTPDGNTFAIKAHPDNTSTVWVGNATAGLVATVSSVTGFPLDPGEGIVVTRRNLASLAFDVEVDGEKICWLKLN